MKVKVLEIRFTKESKTTRAFADIFIEGVTIKDFRICQTNGDSRPFVKKPFTVYKDADGKLIFRQTINMLPSLEAEVDALILSEYFRKLKENRYENQSR
jgi:hypothetical protein